MYLELTKSLKMNIMYKEDGTYSDKRKKHNNLKIKNGNRSEPYTNTMIITLPDGKDIAVCAESMKEAASKIIELNKI